MHIRYDLLGAIAVAFALVLASPAEAAKAKKNKRSAGAAHSTHQRHAGAAVRPVSAFQGGVLAGPLYNGQEFLGDDPDPSIRAYILKDFGVRYGGSY